MNVWRSGIRLCSRASARTSSRSGSTSRLPGSTPTANQDLLSVAERAAAGVQKHAQVVEHVGGLFVDALVGLLARGAGDLLGLLLHLLADQRRGVEQLDRVLALRTGARAGAPRPPAPPPRPVGRRRGGVCP